RVDPEKSVDSYLFRISANKAKNLFKRAAYDEKMRAYFIEAIESGYEQIETKLFREENSQLLHKLLNKLPSKQREVYTLCKLEGMSYREVSERLNISESAVNSHIRRANALLKQVFVGELGIFILFLFR
ncbi:MAG TPA: sigma-70 family RNA polymerase sigma factor, partial [Sphingobacterium sp.]|nr:sigma-70 family RNA polymerase sigma factor [Sphingobacterium sp.]